MGSSSSLPPTSGRSLSRSLRASWVEGLLTAPTSEGLQGFLESVNALHSMHGAWQAGRVPGAGRQNWRSQPLLPFSPSPMGTYSPMAPLGPPSGSSQGQGGGLSHCKKRGGGPARNSLVMGQHVEASDPRVLVSSPAPMPPTASRWGCFTASALQWKA